MYSKPRRRSQGSEPATGQMPGIRLPERVPKRQTEIPALPLQGVCPPLRPKLGVGGPQKRFRHEWNQFRLIALVLGEDRVNPLVAGRQLEPRNVQPSSVGVSGFGPKL